MCVYGIAGVGVIKSVVGLIAPSVPSEYSSVTLSNTNPQERGYVTAHAEPKFVCLEPSFCPDDGSSLNVLGDV